MRSLSILCCRRSLRHYTNGYMLTKHPLFEGLYIRIPIRLLTKGRGFINQGFTSPKTSLCENECVHTGDMQGYMGTCGE